MSKTSPLKLLVYLLAIICISCQSNNSATQVQDSTAKLPVVAAVYKEKPIESDGPTAIDSNYLLQQIKKVSKKAERENYSTQYAILSDLGLHSGSKRIFLINLATKKIVKSGLVTHGSGTTYQPIGVRLYSNVNGSLCSSLGMYKVGGHYQGQYGLAYKLFGLDNGNSNAYARAIVLHSHSCVPDATTNETICQSWGCPTVSPTFLKTLAGYIDDSEKPMLLYLFDSVKENASAK
jgi:hypothetical protein